MHGTACILQLGKMQHSLKEYLTYMLIVKGIIHDFSLPAVADKAGIAKGLELVGNGGLIHAQSCGNIAHAHFLHGQQIKDLEPGHIGKQLVEIHQPHKAAVIHKLILHSLHLFGMHYRLNTIFAHIPLPPFILNTPSSANGICTHTKKDRLPAAQASNESTLIQAYVVFIINLPGSFVNCKFSINNDFYYMRTDITSRERLFVLSTKARPHFSSCAHARLACANEENKPQQTLPEPVIKEASAPSVRSSSNAAATCPLHPAVTG